MTIRSTRRTFLKQAAVAGAIGPMVLSGAARADAGRKLRHAAIGVGRRGQADLLCIASHPDVQIVALCDVDQTFLNAAAKLHPGARLYHDWRVMLEKEHDNIDSINAAVPNHMHAPIALTAMRTGKHVYCQKPLTHSLYESRRLVEEAAKRPELVTQMGVQTHSGVHYRKAVAMLQFGVIGKIKEAHSWDIVRYFYTGAFTDPPTERRPDRADAVPDHLEWDLWLGVAPERPYIEDYYHTRWWRRWHDFGGGAQGDMGGHMMDVVFDALELTAPKWITSYRSPPFEETFAPNNKLHYRFPGTKYTTGDIDYFWYDTGPVDSGDWPINTKKLPDDGSMLVGEKGYMFLPHGKPAVVLPQDETRETVERFEREADLGIDVKYYEQFGQPRPMQLGHMTDLAHYHQFVDACLGKGRTRTPFAYAGNLTETVLMNTIVNRFPGEKLVWDAKALQFTNKPEANQYLRRDYREGWRVEGLG